jgi:hypothetical protein
MERRKTAAAAAAARTTTTTTTKECEETKDETEPIDANQNDRIQDWGQDRMDGGEGECAKARQGKARQGEGRLGSELREETKRPC